MAANLYEAMFVLDAARGASAVPDLVQHIVAQLTRHEAQIERIELWDERKLAYPVKKVKRGLYFLVYFRVDGSAIDEIRRTIRLSERILRVLILAAQEMAPVKGQLYNAEGEPVQAPEEPPAVPAEAAPAEAAAQPAAEETVPAEQAGAEAEPEGEPAAQDNEEATTGSEAE